MKWTGKNSKNSVLCHLIIIVVLILVISLNLILLTSHYNALRYIVPQYRLVNGNFQ